MLNAIHIRTDEELVIAYQAEGHKALVGELFKRHSLMCFAVCVKYLKNEDAAHDGVMNIFEKLFADLKQHEIKNFKSWLHSVCRNYCFMELRKPALNLIVQLNSEESEDDFMQNIPDLHQAEVQHEKEEKLLALEQAIIQLNQKQRLCVELFYLKLMSYEEISAKTGYSINEVKSYLQNGKRNLKQVLAQQGISLGLILFLWIQQHA